MVVVRAAGRAGYGKNLSATSSGLEQGDGDEDGG